MVKISIIVPVYNAEKYLGQCLESLLNQTYRDIEIVCVNDGSTDSSLELLKKYAQKDERVIVIDKNNEGVSLARNKALEVVQGEYLLFVDSDDWIEITTCNDALTEIQKENADVVMWSYVREFKDKVLPKQIWEEEKGILQKHEVQSKIHRRMIGLIGEELNSPENADALCTIWGKLYRTSIIKENQIQFKDIREIGSYEDGLFNLEFFQYVDRAVYVNQYYYHYRKDNEVSITTLHNDKLREQKLKLIEYMQDYIESKQLPEEYKVALGNRIVLSLVSLGLNVLNSKMRVLMQMKELRDIISSSEYREACKQLELTYFPIHWKIFYGCAKYRITLGVYILLFCIKKIINK